MITVLYDTSHRLVDTYQTAMPVEGEDCGFLWNNCTYLTNQNTASHIKGP